MEGMKITYGGGDTIDANTYINSLIHFTNIAQEVNKSISKDEKIEIRVKANIKGSFIVDLVVRALDNPEAVRGIFSKENISYVKEVVNTIGEVYKVAKHLLGKKPKSIKSDKDVSVQIENNNGQTQVFDFRGANLYIINPEIRNAIAQEFETLENDPNVSSFEIADTDGNDVVTIERDDFYAISSAGSEIETGEDEKIVTKNATLNIVSLDLEFKKKWDFYYLGNKISAKIKDDAFGQQIDKGERFGKGDSLEVDLDIKQQFDKTANTYINKGYTVVKVIKHIERGTQMKIDLGEE